MLNQEYSNLDFLEFLNMIKGYIQVHYNIKSDSPIIYLSRKSNGQTEKIIHTDNNPEHRRIYGFLVDCSKQMYKEIKKTGEQRMKDVVLNNGIKIEINSLNEYEYSNNQISGYIITIKIDVIDALTIEKNKIFEEITGSVNLRKL